MHRLPYEYEWRKVTADCFCCVGAECALWVLLLLGINTQYDDEYTHPPPYRSCTSRDVRAVPLVPGTGVGKDRQPAFRTGMSYSKSTVSIVFALCRFFWVWQKRGDLLLFGFVKDWLGYGKM